MLVLLFEGRGLGRGADSFELLAWIAWIAWHGMDRIEYITMHMMDNNCVD